MRNLFVVGMLVLSAAMYLWLARCIKSGQPLQSALAVWVTSPVLVLMVWLVFQRAQPAVNTLTWGNISYAAVLGDVVILPAAAYVTSYGWQTVGHEIASFWKSGWWLAVAFGLGLLGGWFFHRIGGKSDSNSPILSEQLHDSPLTYTHNAGIFPALLGALLYTILPLLFTAGGRGWFLLATGITVLGWGTLQTIDGIRATLPTTNYWHFNPQWMDVPYNWGRFAPR